MKGEGRRSKRDQRGDTPIATGALEPECDVAKRTVDVKDLTIIGGGPTGLAAAFRAGMHEATCRIIEVSAQLGGQMTALYPEKYVYDVFGLPKILAKDLADNLKRQALQFNPDIHLSELAENLRYAEDGQLIEVTTQHRRYLSRALIITSGNGIITPRKLAHERARQFEGKGIFYSVKRREDFRDRHVVIIGGGDSAADWLLNLHEVTRSMTLVHRSDRFEAHPVSVREIQQLAGRGKANLFTSSIIHELHGNDHLEAVTIRNWRGELKRLPADVLLPMIGFKINLGPIASWGLELEEKRIKVDQRMRTNLPGVFAAGDVAAYPGKIKLIATGFAEAAMAVKSALEYVHPQERVKVVYSSLSGVPATRPS